MKLRKRLRNLIFKRLGKKQYIIANRLFQQLESTTMKGLSIVFIIWISLPVIGQDTKPKVFIEFNNESEGWINEYLEETNNWTIVGTFDASNVLFRVQMSQNAYRAFGKIFIIDSETGETLYSTPNLKGQSSAFNGYAPKKNLAKNLIKEIEAKFDKSKINLNHLGLNKESIGKKDQVANKESGDKYDRLLKLKKLLDEGILTDEEYEKEKKTILEGN